MLALFELGKWLESNCARDHEELVSLFLSSPCSFEVAPKARDQLPSMSMLLNDVFSHLLLHLFVHPIEPARDVSMINV